MTEATVALKDRAAEVKALQKELSAARGEAKFHAERTLYFERIVGRCHNALGENASSDHDMLPESIEKRITERDRRIDELYALQIRSTTR